MLNLTNLNVLLVVLTLGTQGDMLTEVRTLKHALLLFVLTVSNFHTFAFCSVKQVSEISYLDLPLTPNFWVVMEAPSATNEIMKLDGWSQREDYSKHGPD